MDDIKKSIKISWVAPNGRNYSDIVSMTLDEYTTWVNDLLQKKKS